MRIRNSLTIVLTLLVFIQLWSVNTNNYQDVVQDSVQHTVKRNPPSKFIPPKYTKNVAVYKVGNVPNPKDGVANGFISDPNGYISAEETYKLNTILWEIEEKTTAQIAVVILKSIGEEVPKDFAVKLFEKWKIGQAEKDNGLLILTVIDQRRTEFEVGYGLESILTDLICHRIGTDDIVPNFKKGAFGAGLIAAVHSVKRIIETPEAIEEVFTQDIQYEREEPATYVSLESRNTNLIFYGLLAFYVLLTWIFIHEDKEKVNAIDRSKEDFYDKYNDLLTLKSSSGCLSYLIFFLFPVSAIFYYIARKKKLKKYRYAPRFSRVRGEELFLKKNWEEAQFLKQGEVLEEELKSYEYDVWTTIDEEDILILKYKGSSRKYSNCSKCGFKTYGLVRTVILESATYTSSGEKEKIYECKNCHYTHSEIVTIPKLERETESSSFGSSGSFSSGGSSFGGSSSSSSWGGGSSGGGGAGVSW
ncbi:TPM domain-containing protein [Tenacibaculum amylolyticum]|uniref:TPM domain-containing protein n=1 Tax=Tenacibaculum amylolyticum TaxID=104269 RepID=UPI0038963C70